jgi:hypothetical protein
MATYYVDMDVTFSAHMWVDADTEEQARKIAIKKMAEEPRYHTRNGCHIDTTITDIFEDED